MAVEVRINRARCIASKCCTNLAPGVFALDETRVSSVIDPSGAPDETIVEAAESCPTGAISIWRASVQLV
ncbi:MAG: ferredoxin [Acidimicrobiales bacterium]